MCGIVGYVGKKDAMPVLLDGIKCLEYRGYDSSGMAILKNQSVRAVKAVGKIAELEKKIKKAGRGNLNGHMGIAHTRWATHGKPSEPNAHPHADCTGKLWLAHNGIIENHDQLRKFLVKRGHKFLSETDTEVLTHLVENFYEGNLAEALRKALKLVRGAYGIVLFHTNEPDKLLAAKNGSPMVIGDGKDEIIIASDISAILKHTRKVVYLDDGEMAEIVGGKLKIFDANHKKIDKKIQEIEWNLEQAEKCGYKHFMLKEIFEQPDTLTNSMRGRLFVNGRIKLGGLETVTKRIVGIDKIIIIGCGTARHAGMVGKYLFEEIAGIPTETEYASEFRYHLPRLNKRTAVIAVSQSGETADTLAAVKEAKKKGALTLGVVNVVGSSIARATEAGVYNHIGPEISVASTKVFTSQIAIMAMMAVMFAEVKPSSFAKATEDKHPTPLPAGLAGPLRKGRENLAVAKRVARELSLLPEKIKEATKSEKQIKEIVKKYYKSRNFAFLGRKFNYPIAFEGALKLKEISYIHAEGFAAGEMKHGPISMIDKDFPCFFIVPNDSVYEKNLSNMEEIKARGGRIIAIAAKGDAKVQRIADDVIYIPKTMEMLTPILTVIPLQMFAYHMAVLNKKDVDKPRNLAKSVTVE
jgi:glucosamine--fructose-6-phosphate aminotransferase (isomerizing)